MKTILIVLILIPFGILAQRNTGFEFHLSGNHPLGVGAGATFFGGGIGGNVILRDTNIVGFKTGIEINYFHTWAEKSYGGSNGDCHYGVLSFPAMVRFSSKKSTKIFLEAGVYLGVGYGQKEASGNPKGIYGLPSVSNGNGYESYFPGVVITPAIGLGGRFPLSERIDLFLKPEFALTMTEFDLSDRLFETSYIYARFCAGIHLKPKPRRPTKNGVIKIEPLHSFKNIP